jgi:hypothetical protein
MGDDIRRWGRTLDPDRIFSDVERWREEAASTTPSVQPASDLDQDATLSAKWQVAHAAWGCSVSAIDNLAVLRTSLEQAIHPYAPYSLLRVAIENAATAVWLLMPDDSPERVTRRLRLVWDESRDIESLQTTFPAMFKPGQGSSERRDEVRAIAKRAGIPLERIAGRWSWAKVVHEAGECTKLRGNTIELMWRLCSGFAHARDWARWSWLDIDRIGEKKGDVVTTKTTTSIERVMMMTLGAHELLTVARPLYDKRRLAWSSH